MLIYLASQSPRRMELLRQINVPFATLNPAIDESRLSNESPGAYVKRIATSKARRGWQMLATEPASVAKVLIIAADTAVVLGDRVFGKPANRQQAVDTLLALSSKTHQVITSVCVMAGRLPGEPDQLEHAESVTQVSFAPLGEDEADWYWCTGESADKAGAYAIQGLGSIFVSRIDGSYSGVVGLPVFETNRLLARCGWSTMTGEV